METQVNSSVLPGKDRNRGAGQVQVSLARQGRENLVLCLGQCPSLMLHRMRRQGGPGRRSDREQRTWAAAVKESGTHDRDLTRWPRRKGTVPG